MTQLEVQANALAAMFCWHHMEEYCQKQAEHREKYKFVFGSYPEDDPRYGRRTVPEILSEINHAQKRSQVSPAEKDKAA
ncbi:MAG: hypothetical protein FWF37_05005 [Chloroflexi bacterium]|nr:hypothetical protein [Chloroflexota bacterium]